MLTLFTRRRNWASRNPSPAGDGASPSPPPPGSGGRGTLAGERGVGRVPISTRGHIHCGTLYIYVLYFVANTLDYDYVTSLRSLFYFFFFSLCRRQSRSNQKERGRRWSQFSMDTKLKQGLLCSCTMAAPPPPLVLYTVKNRAHCLVNVPGFGKSYHCFPVIPVLGGGGISHGSSSISLGGGGGGGVQTKQF